MVDDADAVYHVGYGLTVPTCALYPQRVAVRGFVRRFPYLPKTMMRLLLWWEESQQRRQRSTLIRAWIKLDQS